MALGEYRKVKNYVCTYRKELFGFRQNTEALLQMLKVECLLSQVGGLLQPCDRVCPFGSRCFMSVWSDSPGWEFDPQQYDLSKGCNKCV